MKRKLTYIALIVILVGVFYLGFKHGISTPYNFWTAKRDIRNNKIQIIALGMKPHYSEVEQLIAKRYGFCFIYTGCIVSTELVNGVKHYNRQVENYLTRKFGDNFWKIFNLQIDSSIAEQIKTDSILNQVSNLSNGERSSSYLTLKKK